jgi:hypothetical protein
MANIQPNLVVVARSKEWIYGRWLAWIAGSNSAEGMAVCRLCVGDGLIPRPGESSRMWVTEYYQVQLSVTFSIYDEKVQEVGLKIKGTIYKCCLDQLLTNDSLADSIL